MGVVHSEIYDLGSRPCDADAACERGKHLTFSCEIDERDETRIVGTGALPDDAHYLGGTTRPAPLITRTVFI